MTFAPVGIRCPDHSGLPQGAQRVTQGVQRASFEGTGALVTKAIIAINVGVYLLELAAGGQINGTGNEIYREGVLYGPVVANGDYWRLFTAMFLHYGPIHLGLNMLALWWFGAAVEQALGRGRYLLLYIVSGLAGSAGALLFAPESLTVGASGAIFGILGAAFVLERQHMYVLGGGALSIIVLEPCVHVLHPGHLDRRPHRRADRRRDRRPVPLALRPRARRLRQARNPRRRGPDRDRGGERAGLLLERPGVRDLARRSRRTPGRSTPLARVIVRGH